MAENDEVHVPKPTRLSNHQTATDSVGSGPAPARSAAQLETVERRPRRKFTVADKARIVKAAEDAVRGGERGALEALMRREGIYSSLLSKWRQQFAELGASGLAPGKPGRKPKFDAKDRELQAALKENRKLERKLHIATLVIELQKKAHAILGIALPEYDEKSL